MLRSLIDCRLSRLRWLIPQASSRTTPNSTFVSSEHHRPGVTSDNNKLQAHLTAPCFLSSLRRLSTRPLRSFLHALSLCSLSSRSLFSLLPGPNDRPNASRRASDPSLVPACQPASPLFQGSVAIRSLLFALKLHLWHAYSYRHRAAGTAD